MQNDVFELSHGEINYSGVRQNQLLSLLLLFCELKLTETQAARVLGPVRRSLVKK